MFFSVPPVLFTLLISIKEKGIFWGMLNAIDRLTRCNGFSPEKYEIHAETHLLSDPVR